MLAELIVFSGLLALWPYLAELDQEAPGNEPHRAGIERAYAHMSALETGLQVRLLEYLRSKPDVRIIGPSATDSNRVATVSFVHAQKRSAEIARAANGRRYGIRFGHFYAHRLCERLARERILHDVDDGVVRVSMLHYNTLAEIDGLIECLESVL